MKTIVASIDGSVLEFPVHVLNDKGQIETTIYTPLEKVAELVFELSEKEKTDEIMLTGYSYMCIPISDSIQMLSMIKYNGQTKKNVQII